MHRIDVGKLVFLVIMLLLQTEDSIFPKAIQMLLIFMFFYKVKLSGSLMFFSFSN